jgi:hypothetical protein
MKFPVTGYVVMIHKPGFGTYAPTFESIDEAEDFSNAMRLLIETAAISEPVPVVATERVLMPGERAVNHMASFND